jgi:hypothetical protein
MTGQVAIRILGRDLPGRRFGPEAGDVHVGVQRGREAIDLVPGDAADAVFELSVGLAPARDGRPDFRGPYAQGRPGERFLYLSWGRVSPGGGFEMFRRAKLWLDAIEPALLERALATGAAVEGRLPLTDRSGGPLCSSVRPPLIEWRLTDQPDR